VGILLSAVLDTLSKQLEEKKAIGCSQRGSTKGKSCLTNLFEDGNGALAVVNGRLRQLSATRYEITSDAPYPHAVKFIHRQQVCETTAPTVIYDTTTGFQTK